MDFNNYTKGLYSSGLWYYSMPIKHYASLTEFNIILKDDVDVEILTHAVEKVSKRFPHMWVQIKKNEKEWYIAHNDRPIAIKESKTSFPLGGEQSNYHLWGIFYSGKKMAFIAHHGLMDGRGAMPLRASILYYYFKEKYDENLKPCAAVRTIESEISPDEYCNPFEKIKALPGYNEITLEAPAKKESYLFHDDHKLTKQLGHCTVIEMPQDEFMTFCKAHGGTPNTVVSLIYSEIMEKAKTTANKNKDINFSIVADLKARLGVPLCNETLIGCVDFNYNDYKDLSFAEQNAKLREALKAGVSEENVLKMAKGFATVLDMIDANPTAEEKLAFASQLGVVSSASVSVSYSGRSEWGDMEQYIEALFVGGRSDIENFLEINSISGKIFVAFINNFAEDTYIREFMKILKENNVSSKIIEVFESQTGKVEL